MGVLRMAITFTREKINMVVLESKILQDKELSLEAKGFYGTLMYLSNEFISFGIDKLYDVCPELSESKIKELLEELNKAGYLTYSCEE